ncbi:hypothetical protein EYF80_003195 [Liparis tanakae]|uniref:Uncharacterized protein n=1 Tax=Liparis tanakae TaxID=230148 RepID=A0A4Z2J7V5_9TELE|nr:hypothetical protein EYF80_003195 [Liparis tanakae]
MEKTQRAPPAGRVDLIHNKHDTSSHNGNSLITIKPIKVNTVMLIRGSLRLTIKMIHGSAGVEADENKGKGKTTKLNIAAVSHHHRVLFADLGGSLGLVIVGTVVLVGVPVDATEQVATATVEPWKHKVRGVADDVTGKATCRHWLTAEPPSAMYSLASRLTGLCWCSLVQMGLATCFSVCKNRPRLRGCNLKMARPIEGIRRLLKTVGPESKRVDHPTAPRKEAGSTTGRKGDVVMNDNDTPTPPVDRAIPEDGVKVWWVRVRDEGSGMEGCRVEGTRSVEGVVDRRLEGCDDRPLLSGGRWERVGWSHLTLDCTWKFLPPIPSAI